MERNYYLLTFHSTHAAMAAERALTPHLPVTVMPTLRQITAACGISLRVEPPFYSTLQKALEREIIPPRDCRLYSVRGNEITEVTDY